MKSIVFILALIFTFQISAQQFEGEISFSISYLEIPTEMNGMESMLPTVMNYSISGDKIAIQQNTMFGTQTVVSNNATHEGFVLMDMMGQKIAMKVDNTPEDEETPLPAVTKTTETKKVAGYTCTKYLVKMEGMDTEVWATADLKGKVDSKSHLDGVDGFPLEYVTTTDEMKMLLTATSVTKKAIESSVFEIPEGYMIMTEEELKSSFGQ